MTQTTSYAAVDQAYDHGYDRGLVAGRLQSVLFVVWTIAIVFLVIEAARALRSWWFSKDRK